MDKKAYEGAAIAASTLKKIVDNEDRDFKIREKRIEELIVQEGHGWKIEWMDPGFVRRYNQIKAEYQAARELEARKKIRKRKARALQKENPGMKYTTALRQVLAEEQVEADKKAKEDKEDAITRHVLHYENNKEKN